LASTVPSAKNLKPEGLVDLTILADAKTAP
jgi:hypothetical protein